MFERFFQNSVVFWPGRKVGPGQHADGLRKGKGRKHKNIRGMAWQLEQRPVPHRRFGRFRREMGAGLSSSFEQRSKAAASAALNPAQEKPGAFAPGFRFSKGSFSVLLRNKRAFTACGPESALPGTGSFPVRRTAAPNRFGQRRAVDKSCRRRRAPD